MIETFVALTLMTATPCPIPTRTTEETPTQTMYAEKIKVYSASKKSGKKLTF